MAGDYLQRDGFLLGILGSEPLARRQGNSLEDLRLSVKGWIFGQHIAHGTILSSQDAARWLRDNLTIRP